MKLSKNVQRTLMTSAIALALGMGAANAANTDFGSCIGSSAPNDCTAGTGHASISVTSTLSINEMRALSFGNFAATTPGAGDTIVLKLDGSRTADAGFTPLYGAAGGGDVGTAASHAETGSQSPGHYTISGGAEGGTAQVYISFADNQGNVIDMCDDDTLAVCDDYHNGNSVSLGNGLTLDHFFINQTGSDVYGHYITNTAGGQSPGISDPWLPGGGTAHTSGASDGATNGQIDVVVGGRLTSSGAALTVGKHTGDFIIMASY